jgi:hypothetical protein
VAAVAAPELDKPSVGAAMGATARRRAAEAQAKRVQRPSDWRGGRAVGRGRRRGQKRESRGRGKVHDLD